MKRSSKFQRSSTNNNITKSNNLQLRRTVRDTRPGGTRGGTIKAYLIRGDRLDLAELKVLVRRRDAHLSLAGGRVVAIFAQITRVLVCVRCRRTAATITISRIGCHH